MVIEDYKNPKWQKKRLEVLSKYKFKCEDCGSTTKTLHVHHILYRKGRKVWEYDEDEFLALCADCHDRLHIDIKLMQVIISYLNKETRANLIKTAKKLLKTERGWDL